MSTNRRYRRLAWLRWRRKAEEREWYWDLAWPLTRRIWWASTDRRLHSTVPMANRTGRRRRLFLGVLLRQMATVALVAYQVHNVAGLFTWTPRPTLGQTAAAYGLALTAELAAIVAAVWAAWTTAPSAVIRRLFRADCWLVDKTGDGDTITCSRHGETLKIRIAGVDTPERGQPYCAEATEYTRRLSGRTVRLIDLRRGVDKYGRSLAYVRVDGADWGLSLIRTGLARARDFGEDHPRRAQYEAAQRAAEAAGRGLWSIPTLEPEGAGR